MTRRSLALASACATAGLLLGSLPAFGYSDVSGSESFAPAVDRLSAAGHLEGYSDGTYRPYARVNRAEFLKVLVRTTVDDPISTDVRCFADFRGTEQWYWGYACRAKELGIIHGYPDGTFQGWRDINLAEALKISINTWGVPLPQYFREPDHWYDPYLDAAAGLGVFTHIRRDPAHLVTRGEMAILLDIGAGVEKKECISSADCPADQRCSTERGDCQSACPPGTEICPQVCAGVCEPRPEPGSLSCTQRKERIEELFAENKSCSTTSDCMVFSAACPFVTCGEAINRDSEAEIQAEVDAYIDYCDNGMCASCLAQTAVCERGECVLRELQ